MRDVSTQEARQIAKEAYIYANAPVVSYRILYSYFVDENNPDYKAPWNQIENIPRVYTHQDKAVQTPNSDTPYSWLALDLRAEPIVLTVPPIEKERYFSIQLIDLYTHNFAYIGSRTTGNGGGNFLIAGPGWEGEKPKNISKVIRAELDDFVRDEDGGITLYLQHDSPGKDKEPNWLPAPAGSFSATLRLYWPKAEALNGTWTPPPVRKA